MILSRHDAERSSRGAGSVFATVLLVASAACVSTPPPDSRGGELIAYEPARVPAPVVVRTTTLHDAAVLNATLVNYDAFQTAVMSTGLGLIQLGVSAIAQAAEEAENRRRIGQREAMRRALAAEESGGFGAVLQRHIEEASYRSPWLEPIRFEHTRVPQRVIAFDTRDAAVLVVTFDLRFSLEAETLLAMANVQFYPRGDLDPSYERLLLHYFESPDARSLPVATTRTSPGMRKRPSDDGLSTAERFDERLEWWVANDGENYRLAVGNAIEEILELIEQTLLDPLADPPDASAETVVVRLRGFGSGGRGFVVHSGRLIERTGDRLLVQLGDHTLVSAPETARVDRR